MKYDPNLAERLNREAELEKKRKPKQKVITQTASPEEILHLSKDFSLEELTDFYRINGISYRNEIYTVDLSKTLLESRTQDQHANQRKKAVSDEFTVADMPLYYAIKFSLYQNRDNKKYSEKILEVRDFIKKQMFGNWLMTLSRVRYNPQGKDIVIHDCDQASQYEIPADFMGNDNFILKISGMKEPLNALLGVNHDVKIINDVYKWLTDKDSYIFRVNSTPSKIDERVVGFGAVSGGSWLGCDRGPQYSSFSLGVRRKKFSSENKG